MRQTDLNRAVARATGETISTIKRLGFSLDEPADETDLDLDGHEPHVVDWDTVEALRNEPIMRGPRYEPVAV